MIEYFVTSKEINVKWCPACRGTGKVKRQMGGAKYEADCVQCGGTGKYKSVITSETSLMVALQELGITINSSSNGK
jgi:RecJ-like exonuclease